MLDFGRRALGLTLLVAGALTSIHVPVATQARPSYRVDPWWPRPFTNQSWVLGSITGVTVDSQNHVWVVHRGGDSLEANEKGMMLTPPSAGLCCQSAPQVLEFDQKGVLVSSWGSNEELAALKRALPERCTAFVKSDRLPQAGERGDDAFLIRADKNPNRAAARALFPLEDDGHGTFIGDTDLVVVWGGGFDFGRVPAGSKLIVLDAYDHPAHAGADVFIPLSIQTERNGHYTNFQGVVSAFSACFAKPPTVANAESVFAELAVEEGMPA